MKILPSLNFNSNFSLLTALLLMVLFFTALPLKAQQPKDIQLLVVIDGKVSTQAALAEMPQENILKIDFLSARDAGHIYGLAGAGGALIVKTRKEKIDPLVVKDGRVISSDSLVGMEFQKINVLSRRQAVNLYGPKGLNGALLVEGAEAENTAEKNTCCTQKCCKEKEGDKE